MGLETGSTIASFITSNPTSSDPVNQGDDHLRLIKSVLQAQFPGTGGLGYATAITATEAELNYVHGVTSNIQTQINNILPSGTKLAFFQAAAPSGWTQITTYANHMLRVVSGVGGGFGGTHSPILNNISVPAHTHTFSGTFTGAALPTHSHLFNTPINNQSLSGGGSSCSNVVGSLNGTTQAVSAGTPSGTIAGTNANNTAVSWTPQYLDNILCSKN